MTPVSRLVLAAVAVLCAGSFAAAAAAARRTEPIDLSRAVAKAVVEDAVFDEAPPKPPPARIEQFVDSHGHTFRVGTDVVGLDLLPYANVLSATVHGDETDDVLVDVIPPEQIAAVCGPGFAACYYNDPTYGRGWMYIPTSDPDLQHIIVHEYGHHVDNQLLNLAHLNSNCLPLGDGSRNWLFARKPAGFTCNSAQWETLLGELYAEDYVSLNGFDGWVLTAIRAPTQVELNALAFDFARPFWPRDLRKSAFVPRLRVLVKRFTVRHWTLVEAVVTGKRSAGLDLYLYRDGRRRALAMSARPGSREVIRRALRPGKYEAVVHAFRAGGTARLRLHLR